MSAITICGNAHENGDTPRFIEDARDVARSFVNNPESLSFRPWKNPGHPEDQTIYRAILAR